MPAEAPYLDKLAEGIYAFIQPDGGWCLNNAGIVTDGATTVLVDTAATQRRARSLRMSVEAHGIPLPRTLINTHHHGDHTFGNGVFPEATVHGHADCRREMIAAGIDLPRIWPHVQWGDIPLVPPTVTYTDRLVLHTAGTEIHLIHPGPAHTSGDTIVWLPERRTVFTGDLVFSGAAPFILYGCLAGSLDAVRFLRELDAATIVPGHGDPCGPEVYDTTERYLLRVQELAAQGRAAGRTPLETARQHADDPAFAGLAHPERLVANLHRAYAELDGTAPAAPLDLPPVLTDLVALNGGAVPDCHA